MQLLRHRADRRSLAFVGTYFALIALGYSATLPWWGNLGLTLALCLMSFFCAVITHNSIHSPVFYAPSFNQLFHVALTLAYGHPVNAFVPGHNLSHHRYTQKAKDAMRTSKLRFRWNWLNQLLFSQVVGPTIFRDNLAYVRYARQAKPRWYRQFMGQLLIYLAYLSAALVLDWQKFLLFVFIPHQYAAWGIMGINFVQHDGCDADSPYNHSRNFVGKWTNWWTFNNGYHGMHHMKPSLHWSLLPRVHHRELHPHIHPNLEQRSLLAYAWRAYIYPGQRLHYEGGILELEAPVADEPWVPSYQTQRADDAQAAPALLR